MVIEVKHRGHRWLGKVLRMELKGFPRLKMTLRKTFEGDFKKMEPTLGTAEREAKERISWRKRNGCIILNG